MACTLITAGVLFAAFLLWQIWPRYDSPTPRRAEPPPPATPRVAEDPVAKRVREQVEAQDKRKTKIGLF